MTRENLSHAWDVFVLFLFSMPSENRWVVIFLDATAHVDVVQTMFPKGMACSHTYKHGVHVLFAAERLFGIMDSFQEEARGLEAAMSADVMGPEAAKVYKRSRDEADTDELQVKVDDPLVEKLKGRNFLSLAWKLPKKTPKPLRMLAKKNKWTGKELMAAYVLVDQWTNSRCDKAWIPQTLA